MFGFSSTKQSSDHGDEDRLAEWQRSPSVPVKKATGLKTRILLGNIGRELRVVHRKEPCVIRPLSVFRKPAYNRMYVEAECAGETRIFNISDLMIRRPDSDSFYDDDEPAPRNSSLPLLLLLVVLLAGGAAAAVYLGVVPVDFAQLLGDPAEQPNVVVAPPPDNNKGNPPAEELPAKRGTALPAVADPAEQTNRLPAATDSTPPITPAEDPTFGRAFSDTRGDFRVRAEFVEFQPDRGRGSRVILRKADGTQVDVAMNRLSKEDQLWIRDEVKRRKQSETK